MISATPASFSGILKDAKDGDVVRLSPGAYPPLELSGRNDLTIHGSPSAILASVSATECKRLTLHGLRVKGQPMDGRRRVTGIMLRRCERVAVRWADVSGSFHGIGHVDCDNVEIGSNTIHHIPGDGIRGNSSHILITGNRITETAHDPAFHADAIQFWSKEGWPTARNVVIHGNAFLKGAGMPMQGVLLGCDPDQPPFEAVLIEDNLIYGALDNGIMVVRAKDATIRNNLVVSVQGDTGAAGRQTQGRILLRESTGGVVLGNRATRVNFPESTGYTAMKNTQIEIAKPGDLTLIAPWLAAHQQPAGEAGRA